MSSRTVDVDALFSQVASNEGDFGGYFFPACEECPGCRAQGGVCAEHSSMFDKGQQCAACAGAGDQGAQEIRVR